MIQNKYSLKPLSEYVKKHPNSKNKELYELCNAITNSQKQNIRRKKLTLLKKIKDTKLPDTKLEKLSSDDLEKRIVKALDRHPDNAQILGKAIEFFIKIKGKVETIDESFDMEELRRLGLITDVSK